MNESTPALTLHSAPPERALFRSMGVDPHAVGPLICEMIEEEYALENMFPLQNGNIFCLFVDAVAKQQALMRQQYESAAQQQAAKKVI